MGDPSKPNDHNADRHSTGPTIVGGRPFAGRSVRSSIPRGIEVLVKKASVDPEFRKTLLERRAKAAEEIGLELTAAEAAMLDSVPPAQIGKIIENTTVPDEQRRVFLGKIGVAMLAVLGIGLSTAGCITLGHTARPEDFDRPDFSKAGGIRPDRPDPERGPEPPALKPKPKAQVEAVPVAPKRERLKVTTEVTGIYSLAVTVGYDCPFDSGNVRISFRGRGDRAEHAVTCEPAEVAVSKGKGEAKFKATGKGVTTDRIVAGLLSARDKCREKASKDFEDVPDLMPGQYLVGDCLICEIVQYFKDWPA
jgi:hypothetical protein